MIDDVPHFAEAFTKAAITPPDIDFQGVALGDRWPVTRTGEREPIPPTLRRLIWFRDYARCSFCDVADPLLELDHVVPWSAGGPDIAANLRLLCHACNTTRSNRRTKADVAELPVTTYCDRCVAAMERYDDAPWNLRRMPGNPEHAAYCGECHMISTVTDPRRLL